jgi:hypothetical protein
VAALTYAARSWPVFPVDPETKKPLKSAKHSNGKRWGATTDPKAIRRDLKKWPNACIGIPTGEATGFFVLDIDTDAGHGVDGIAFLAQLEATYGHLPQTLMVESPSGSLHYYYKTNDLKILNSTSAVAPGIDVRGEGGMVIAPPSRRKGGQYHWLNEHPIADPPAWLLDLVKSDDSERAPGAPQADPERVRRALDAIPNDDLGWEDWNRIGMAIWNATGGSQESFHQFDAWSRKSKKYDEAETRARWKHYATSPPTKIGAGTLFYEASMARPGWEAVGESGGITLNEFYCYLPQPNSYLFTPTAELWPGTSVDRCLPPVVLRNDDGTPVMSESGGNNKRKPVVLRPSQWLAQKRPVHQMIWAPGEPSLIRDKVMNDGGWIRQPGACVYNLYRRPTIKHGDRRQARRWIKLVLKLFRKDVAKHIIRYLAFKVQNPGIKINHIIVIGGEQGVGKDSLLEPVKYAVGHWNFQEIAPSHLMGRFNGWAKATVLRISEARDNVSRYEFYEKIKTYAAAPPDVHRCDEKNLREHYVANVCGGVITTNHKTGGLYLPPEDRRHYVAWTYKTKEDFSEEHWNGLWEWYFNGGIEHVAAYLATLDLSTFDPKAPPYKTDEFWEMVNAERPPEDLEMADAIEALQRPDALTVDDLRVEAAIANQNSLLEWLNDRKYLRHVPARLERLGYVQVLNNDRKDKLFTVGGRRQIAFARAELTPGQRVAAVQALDSKSKTRPRLKGQ